MSHEPRLRNWYKDIYQALPLSETGILKDLHIMVYEYLGLQDHTYGVENGIGSDLGLGNVSDYLRHKMKVDEVDVEWMNHFSFEPEDTCLVWSLDQFGSVEGSIYLCIVYGKTQDIEPAWLLMSWFEDINVHDEPEYEYLLFKTLDEVCEHSFFFPEWHLAVVVPRLPTLTLEILQEQKERLLIGDKI